MTLLIGIDEAGYGPNFGPLCIGATAWQVDEKRYVPSATMHTPQIDLYQLLDEIVSPAPAPNRMAIADSKLLYKPKQGLAHLERGVLTALAAIGKQTPDWRSLLAPPVLPWYAGFNCPLPIDATAEEVAGLNERFLTVCETANVRLVDMRSRLVFPQEFNELTEHYGTKGAALSHVSIGLVREVIEGNADKVARGGVGGASLPTSLTRITCDKHGGRNRYAALLQHHFSDEQIEVLEESRPRSRYRWGPSKARTEICFRTQGEAELPVALASMIAKYHRELAMRAFNAFWAKQIPGLKPTAGYPQDAKRFKSEIAVAQSKLGIDDRSLWRNR